MCCLNCEVRLGFNSCAAHTFLGNSLRFLEIGSEEQDKSCHVEPSLCQARHSLAGSVEPALPAFRGLRGHPHLFCQASCVDTPRADATAVQG